MQASVYQATGGAQSPEYRNGLVRAPRWRLRRRNARGRAARPQASQPARSAGATPVAAQPALQASQPARNPLAAYGADVVAASDAGDWERVAAIGWDFSTGKNGRTRNSATAVALGRAACEGNNALGCTVQGRELLEGDRANWPTGLQALRRGCEAGSAGACGLLGAHYVSRVVPSDYAQSNSYYRMGCDGGVATACGGLGIAYAAGLGIAKDSAAAVPLLRRSCDGGSTPACGMLATLLSKGEGAPRDPVGARALLERSCPRDPSSCNFLAEMYQDGVGGPRDPALAAQTYRTALQGFQHSCESDHFAAACAQVGYYYDRGFGAPANRDLAVGFIARRCSTTRAILSPARALRSSAQGRNAAKRWGGTGRRCWRTPARPRRLWQGKVWRESSSVTGKPMPRHGRFRCATISPRSLATSKSSSTRTPCTPGTGTSRFSTHWIAARLCWSYWPSLVDHCR